MLAGYLFLKMVYPLRVMSYCLLNVVILYSFKF